MKIKVDNIDFISFSDGVCNIYTEDEDENKVYKFKSLGFNNRVLGFNRYFAAKAVQIKTDLVIRIPNVPGIDSYDTVEMPGMGKYSIQLIQDKFDTNPLSKDLTLRHLEMDR